MDKKFGKIAVLMGGNSAEREISLRSGEAVLQALLRQDVEAVGVDLRMPRDAFDELRRIGPDKAFIILHGRGGEDGVMQALLDMMEIPYTGSGQSASAIAMDKHLTKLLWQGAGIPTPASRMLREAVDWQALADELGLPLMLKPSHEGSSVGMSKVSNAGELEQAWRTAAEFDTDVLAERFISGREYTVGILNGRALPVIRLKTPRDFYDYAAKYTENTTQYICPCGLPAEKEQEVQERALEAFNVLGASGWGRVDVILDEAGDPWFLEVNTVPGMTDHSLVPMAAKRAGMDFDALVLAILETVA